MRVIDENGNEIAEPDLDNGYLFETEVIRPDAEPIGGKSKPMWAEGDFERVLRYVPVPKAERINGEIGSLKARLRETDYISAKLGDALMGCDGLAGVLSAIAASREEYAPVIAERAKWRARIGELEAVLAEEYGEEE